MSAGFTPCADFPGYEVSADGRVYSVASNWRGYGLRELVQDTNSDGYPSVRLAVGGKRKRITVHRLVATAFLGPRPDGSQIRHLDGDQTNNCADNLAWGTAADNAADRSRHGRSALITPKKREAMAAGFKRWWLERNADV